MLKILIAESRSLVQEHLKRMLSGQSSVKIITLVHGGHSFVDALRLQSPAELAIAGWYNSELDSLDWLREAKKISPRLPIMLISNITGSEFVKEVFLLGVSGYLLSNSGKRSCFFPSIMLPWGENIFLQDLPLVSLSGLRSSKEVISGGVSENTLMMISDSCRPSLMAIPMHRLLKCFSSPVEVLSPDGLYY